MFAPTGVVATIPAQDMERAKSFYADRLGLKPVEESEDGARYEIGKDGFFLFPSSGKPSGDHTQLSFDVPDVVAAVRTLRENGVVFEEYDLPGFKSVDGVVELGGEKGAWFKDSEGNLIAIAESMK
ncbi:MAG: VOC family protein [Actinomycetota bacterium]